MYSDYLFQVYTAYVFHIKACTQIGCTEGPRVPLSTAQLPPNFVKAPKLTALGKFIILLCLANC